jgi:hypothetical protein
MSDIDFGRFFAEVWVAVQYSLLQLIFGVATDEKYARDAYDAWSVTARLRIVAKLTRLGLPSELFITLPPSEMPGTQEREQ